MRKKLASLRFPGLFILAVAVSSCSNNSGSNVFGDSDADTDTEIGTDSDSDTNTDTDSDTFTNPVAGTDCKCEESNVFCADSCALEDVQRAADDAMASEISDTTVCIPACDPSPYTWTAGNNLELTTNAEKVIRLMGAGVVQTEILNFQVGVPGSSRLNLVELAHMTFDGNDTVASIMNARLRPETLNTELYWHDLVIENYAANYTLSLEGWLGVISNIEMWCEDAGSSQNPYGIGIHGDGVYSDHSVDFGTRNALFIEDSLFDNCSHSISCFCDAYVVFRNNTVSRSDSHIDLHGPGYNSCYYGTEETAGGGYEVYDNEFVEAQGNWVINARAGQGHIITNNQFDDEGYQILLYWDSHATAEGSNCGTGEGQTCERCYTFGCEGCCQAQEKTYIWGNEGTVREYGSGSEGDCLLEDETYFLRAPDEEDGLLWTPFTYPHPLRMWE